MLWQSFQGFNKRNIRNNYVLKYKSSLMGYKIAFRGRFTRKQRASSLWFHKGKVPLNTLNIDIDYAFVTVPLKNSAVGIKLWLYKNKSFVPFTYIFKI